MQLLRVSVTVLERFRQYLEGSITEKDFVKTLSRRFKGNDFTRVGSAAHAILERQPVAPVAYAHKRWLAVKDKEEYFLFPEATGNKLLDFAASHRSMICETPVERTYKLSGYEITVSGRVDGLQGIVGWDHKIVFTEREVEGYMRSVQWKFYCDMLSGLMEFHYQIWEAEGFKNLKETCEYGLLLRGLKLTPHEPIILYPYPKLRSELMVFLSEFMKYINHRQYFSYLQQARHEAETKAPARVH